jgi:hypothetical protein
MRMPTFSRRSVRKTPRPSYRGERGQSIIVIAVGMVGLLAFVGLTVDAGALFIGFGHLRRAVDAAAFSAASQFREGRTFAELESAAREVVSLNGVEPDTLELRACVDVGGSSSPYHDQTMCPAPGNPQRKLIRVTATTRQRFSFLAIVGWLDTELRASATSEAASVDVVLALDTSSSMTQDAQCGDGDDDDNDGVPDDGCPGSVYGLIGTERDDAWSDPSVCNNKDLAGADGFPGECHPFEEVKSSAVNFVNRLYYPYDRVSIVTFDILPSLVVPITNSLTLAQVTDAIRTIPVSNARQPGNPAQCTYPPDPGGCTNTSIGGGLLQAGNEFGRHPVRQESVWVVILLTDGAANASIYESSTNDFNLYCPNMTWVQPFCRDADTLTRHSVLTTTPKLNTNNVYNVANYDADDYARDMADFVACAPKLNDALGWCTDTLDYAANEGGQGAIIYAIGLGRLVVNFTAGGDPDAGDHTLRYIAAVGDDGDATTDPCVGVPVPSPLTPGNDSYSCGNYFFSEFGTGLTAVFDSIASRLFTRLTQ